MWGGKWENEEELVVEEAYRKKSIMLLILFRHSFVGRGGYLIKCQFY